jgi:hypothetical protein
MAKGEVRKAVAVDAPPEVVFSRITAITYSPETKKKPCDGSLKDSDSRNETGLGVAQILTAHFPVHFYFAPRSRTHSRPEPLIKLEPQSG